MARGQIAPDSNVIDVPAPCVFCARADQSDGILSGEEVRSLSLRAGRAMRPRIMTIPGPVETANRGRVESLGEHRLRRRRRFERRALTGKQGGRIKEMIRT
jgi:hypothetical protein